MSRKVDARFNRHDVPSLEWQIDPQESQSRCLSARPAGQVPAGVADAEADHMSDAVRKKQGRNALFDETGGTASQEMACLIASGDSRAAPLVRI